MTTLAELREAWQAMKPSVSGYTRPEHPLIEQLLDIADALAAELAENRTADIALHIDDERQHHRILELERDNADLRAEVDKYRAIAGRSPESLAVLYADLRGRSPRRSSE